MAIMGETRLESNAPASLQPPLDDRLLLKWLEDQSEEFQSKIAQEKLGELLAKAAQPRHVSGNACIKLCYFIDQCKSSKSPFLRDIAFSKEIGLSLFSFYIEWNEKNQHRSMRQVVELLSSLIDKNPDQQTKIAAKASILERSMSIFSHQASQPLVKPAFKALECLLSKRTISTQELINAYKHHHGWETSSIKVSDSIETDAAWDSFLAEVFEWMTLADISPATGKFLVTVFRELRSICEGGSSSSHTASWQRWIREGLRKRPEALENVKNYLFPPLFKLDRPGSLLFLEDLNTQSSVWDIKNQEFDAQSLLQLAAIETGKKSGLVEEPSTIQFNQKAAKKTSAIIVLQEEPLSALLAHASDTVRSLAFSVLVSSNSTIRPFTLTALSILQSGMSILYCDSDAKFRNEVLSNTKHMIERLRGATAFLVREIESLSFQLRPENSLDPQWRQMAQQALEQTTELLRGHANFVEWYIEFLLGELIPTASYQRHITALKAISLLLRSGILKPSARSPPVKISDNATVWPYLVEFFNPMAMRLLLDLLMDPFEDVRSNATSILKLASPEDFSESEQDEESQGGVNGSQPVGCVQDAADAVQNSLIATPSTSCEENFSTVRKGKSLGLLRDFVEGAKGWSKRTGRADYADGVARSTSLLFSLLSSNTEQTAFLTQLVEDLEAKLSIAEDDLAKAVQEAPVHGTFAALNFVWESINHKDIFRKDLPEPLADTRKHWDSLQLRIVLACTRIWEVVKDILCNDSPEGHLPQDLEVGDVIDTKDVLSYSFRAVHESSNLLQTILEKIQLRWETSLSPPPPEIFTAIGDLTFLQLSTLRHRGAFSTVSLTFTKCCALTQIEPPAASSSSNKLQSWYKGALDCIRKQSSTTRRSAGIPALFTAIMAAHAPSPSFEQAMEELMALARQPVKATEADGSNVYQVHALNSIKEAFKSTALGKRSESYIPQGLELAVRSLQAPKWSIRNSGLILFRSIMDRLFGTSESKAITESGWDGRATRLYYDAFPNLPQLLDDLLKSGTKSGGQLSQPALSVVEIIFPALDIIRRAGPPASHRDSIRNSVLSHLGSPVWHVREIAAHTVCTFMLGAEWKNSLLALLDSPTNSANLRHGVLLAAKYILERRFALDPSTAFAGVSDLVPLLQKLSSDDAQKYKCPIIIKSHIELSIAIAQALVRYKYANDEERAQLDSTKANFCRVAGDFNRPRMSQILGWFYPGYPGNHRAYVQCFPAMARIAVYMMALRRDDQGLSDFVQHISKYGADVQIAAFECIPEAWKHGGSLLALLKINSTALCLSSHTLRVVAYHNVSELLENLSAPHIEWKQILRDLLETADQFSTVSFLEQQQGTSGQAEACCKIKLGAWVSVAAFYHYAEGDPDFAEFKQHPFTIWSHWLTHGLGADNDLDIRLACACALRIFYTKSDKGDLKDWQAFIPSLLALYQALNDDDEEVRNIAASTVSLLLKQPLTPPAAAKKFAAWLLKEYSSSPRFISNLLFQISGSTATSASGNPQEDPFVPAQTQLNLALKEDDSLFAQEEQNLFIDEVREINLWSTLFSEISIQSLTVPRQKFTQGDEHTRRPIMIVEFAAWVDEAVEVLNKAMRKDGPLGWTSKPPAFKMAFRVLRCANALLEYDSKLSNWSNPLSYEDESYLKFFVMSVVSGLETFCLEAKAKNIHPRLLREAQSRSLLNPAINKVSLIWPNQKGGS